MLDYIQSMEKKVGKFEPLDALKPGVGDLGKSEPGILTTDTGESSTQHEKVSSLIKL